VEVVVGTPGRLIDLEQQRILDLSGVQSLVLDEADEMLDMGFLPDVEKLVSKVPAVRQTMLFSATMPGQILNLARRYMSQPTHIRATDPGDDTATVEAIEQHVWRAHSMDKPELIGRILRAGFAAGSVHGDLGQAAREKALQQFRDGIIDVLVATDVAARGIDVEAVTHVINYTCPDDEKNYLHRIGRTGRAGSEGVAVTLVDWDDMHRWKLIDKALGLPFAEPIETYSTSDHVYTGLGIKPGTRGRLTEPKPQQSQSRPPRSKSRQGGSGKGGSGRPAAREGDQKSAPGSSAPRQRRRRRTRKGGQDTPAQTS
jgi:superfamily II DNA/RNA helicase